MSLQQGATNSFSAAGGVRQKLTPEYLAKQLPLFQERVPRLSQEPLKFPTDAPPNLPLPPLLPGEKVLLKQHRVACLEAFSEPAVGSLYLTNFRLIFNGNSISDPESREAMQEGLPMKKEHTFSLESGRLTRLRSTRHSPNFTSFLTNPDQGTASSSPKLRMNSLRRSNRSASENTLASTQVKKSSSLRRSPLKKPDQESTTDGPGSVPTTSAGSVFGDVGTVLHRGARSLHIPGKRKGMVQRESGTVRWDSVSSVSSVSELSECPTTGTDETSERENISPVPPTGEVPVFSIGASPPRVGVPNGSAPPDTPPASLDSGVITDPLTGSWATASGSLGQNGCGSRGMGNGNVTLDEVDFEKYSAAILGPILESAVNRRELESSVDPSLFLDPHLERERQERTRRSWFKRSMSPSGPPGEKGADEGAESVSDDGSDPTGEDDEDEISRTLTQDCPPPVDGDSAPVGYSKVEIISPEEAPPTLTTSDPTARPVSPLYSVPVKVTGRGAREREKEKKGEKKEEGGEEGGLPVVKPLPPTPPLKKPLNKGATCLGLLETSDIGVGGASCEGVRGEDGRGYANFALLRDLPDRENRDRSLSIPSQLKKPMPLPRKAGTLDRMDDNGRGLGRSLPANFKPAPPPRKPTLSPSASPKAPRSQLTTTSRPPISPKPSLTLSRGGGASQQTPPTSKTLPRTPPSKRSPLTLPKTLPTSRTLPRTPSKSLTPPKTPPKSRTPPKTPPKSRTPPRTPPRPSPHTPHREISNTHTTSANQASDEVGTSPERISEVGVASREVSPVAPPRRKRKSKGMPTHDKGQSPSSWETKTVGVPSSDAGSSDLASSESDVSRNHKFLPSPSPHPNSPSPPPSPHSWHEDPAHNSSVIAQRHSIPSLRSSLPPSSPLDHNCPGYEGERETLVVASPYQTLPASPSTQPTSTRYSLSCSLTLLSIHSVKKLASTLLKEDGIRLPEGIVVQTRNFRSMKLHVHPRNKYDADGLKDLLEKRVLVETPTEELFAFHYCSAIRHPNPNFIHNTSLPNFFKLQDEWERLKLTDSSIWHISSVLKSKPEVSPTYPRQVIVPRCIPDLDVLRGAKLYRNGRFPTLTWCRKESSVFLLRAAPTLSHRGQSGNMNMRLDEAILQAICFSTDKAQGNTKLCIFTEKPDSTPTAALSDPMHTSLTAAQKRAYYYHNCQFQYIVSPPTFKNVRHSFRKLSALLEENKVGEEEFLIALDDTQWLYRIQELLQTTAAVVTKLEEEQASVLVSYDSGLDRTTQISSLAQLLLDPYYRTMDGFQVLVQKEWVWFGHPFLARHTRHGRVKEDGPIFLQWVDCIWQVMHQCPSAFEFNEKFLMVLVESSYSGQFGSFLLNNEQERNKTLSGEAHKHKSVATHTLSLWTWVAMVNAAGRTFYNNLYDPHTYPWVIYPNCTVPCLKLWTRHYSQSKYQDHHYHSTNTTPLQKQLDQLVRECQRLSSKVDVSTTTKSPSVTLSPAISGGDSKSSFKMEKERERERVRLSGRSSRSKTPVFYHSIEQYLASQGIDSSVCKHAVIVGNTCQGLLVKLGGVRKHWQERWFVLDFASHLLTYFESKEEFTATDRSTPKGVIELTNMTKVWQNDKKKDHLVRHIFTVETKSRTYLFRAPSLITMQFWIAMLNMPRSALTVES